MPAASSRSLCTASAPTKSSRRRARRSRAHFHVIPLRSPRGAVITRLSDYPGISSSTHSNSLGHAFLLRRRHATRACAVRRRVVLDSVALGFGRCAAEQAVLGPYGHSAGQGGAGLGV